MAQYWLGEIERVLAGEPEPVPFGRIATDPVRIGVVGRDRSLPPRELYDRIDDALTRFDRRWRTLTPADLARRGLHPTRGELTVAAMPTGSSSATSPSTSSSSRRSSADTAAAG